MYKVYVKLYGYLPNDDQMVPTVGVHGKFETLGEAQDSYDKCDLSLWGTWCKWIQDEETGKIYAYKNLDEGT